MKLSSSLYLRGFVSRGLGGLMLARVISLDSLRPNRIPPSLNPYSIYSVPLHLPEDVGHIGRQPRENPEELMLAMLPVHSSLQTSPQVDDDASVIIFCPFGTVHRWALNDVHRWALNDAHLPPRG